MVVDDFGVGHSNLKRIIDLEPQVVKLDLALIRGIDRSKRQQILVRQVVSLCKELGARVVAEGIETEDELLAVTGSGAHYGQGYLFARPAFSDTEGKLANRAQGRRMSVFSETLLQILRARSYASGRV